MLSIYRASAGSGKTYKLAYEYIRLLLGYKDSDDGKFKLNRHYNNRHSAILAITFTNKATDEMKRRIIHELAVLAGKEPGWTEKSDYLDDLMQLFGCTEEDLREVADKALTQLLYNFGFFQIRTIDTFFQTILRTFANEAELSGNYEVELDAATAINEGVGGLFNSFNSKKPTESSRRLMEWVKKHLMEKLADGDKVNLLNRESNPYKTLIELIGNLSNEKLDMRYDEMMAYLDDPDKLVNFKTALVKAMENLKENTRKQVESTIALFSTYAFPPSLRIDDCKPMKTFRLFLNDGTINATVKSFQDRKDDDKRIKSLLFNKGVLDFLQHVGDTAIFESVKESFEAIWNYDIMSNFYSRLNKSTFVLGILANVFSRISEYRKENNILHLADTNSLLSKIIGDDETPFVYERLGTRLHHFLIDEFQDTSDMQWRNLKPLLFHSLAEGNDNLIIGDEKQCIYRFRNSDPSLLSNKVFKDFKSSIEPYSAGGEGGKDKNWRSLPDVIRFNNRLFDALGREYDPYVYSNVVQEPSKADSEYDQGGFVKITSFEKKADKETIFGAMADDIRRQIYSGYFAGEIAVLVRSNKQGSEIVDYLIERQDTDPDFPKFNIITEDVIKISDSPAVAWIISQLRLSTLPKRNSSERIEKDAVGLAGRVDNLLGKEMGISEALAKAIEGEGEIERVNSSDEWTLLSVVENIAFRKLPEELAKSQQPYISEFLDIVYEYTSSGFNDVRSFLKWWDKNGVNRKMILPLDSHALKVMTIHKAKGLEFPCVHLPVINWSVTHFDKEEWFDLSALNGPGDPADIPPMIPLKPSEWLVETPLCPLYLERKKQAEIDELNVLYVAFTRAGRELSVWTQVNERNQMDQILNQGLLKAFSTAGTSDSPFSVNENGEMVFTYGSPTKAGGRKEKKKNATEPTQTEAMPIPVRSKDRDIWAKLKFDLDDDN